MYDAGKIIPGLIVFVGLMLFAIYYNVGNKIEDPKPEKPVGYTSCVLPLEEIRAEHMVLLNEWRDEVIREGKREKVEAGGKMYEKSLQNGCMHCHTSQEKFCDECHKYASVNPYCWDCHVTPEYGKALGEAN